MKRLALAGCLAAFLVSASCAQAETVSLGYKQDTGPHPSAFFWPETLERPESFQVAVSATPAQPFEYEQSVHCTRGSESISAQPPMQVITPPFSAVITPTLAEADSCWISVSVEAPFDDDVPGTVRVDVTGNRRPAPLAPALPPSPPPPSPPPYWTLCLIPHWLRSGEVKVHGGVTCATGKMIATKAWKKPARAGNNVRVRGYSCLRSELRGRATVRCNLGTKAIKIKGRLR
jgi:hypothetical protein